MELLGIVFLLLFGCFSWRIATEKGRSGFVWFLAGALLGPFGLIVALLPPQVGNDYRRCPYCAEVVRLEAIKCRYCCSELEVAERSAGAPFSKTERSELIKKYSGFETHQLEKLLEEPASLRVGEEELIKDELKHRAYWKKGN